jgi:hypothetical protein
MLRSSSPLLRDDSSPSPFPALAPDAPLSSHPQMDWGNLVGEAVGALGGDDLTGNVLGAGADAAAAKSRRAHAKQAAADAEKAQRDAQKDAIRRQSQAQVDALKAETKEAEKQLLKDQKAGLKATVKAQKLEIKTKKKEHVKRRRSSKKHRRNLLRCVWLAVAHSQSFSVT